MHQTTLSPAAVWSGRTFWIASLLCVTSLALTAGLANSFKNQADQRVRLARAHAENRAKTIAKEVAAQLNRIKPLCDQLAEELRSGQLGGELLASRLQEVYEEHRIDCRLLEVGVAWEPEHNPQNPGQIFAPHFGLLNGGNEKAFDVSESYDYRTYDWYRVTKELGPYWIDPYFGQATERWAAGYATPFFQAPDSEVVAGVVRINFDLNKVSNFMIEKVNNYLKEDTALRAGYVFLLSKRNKIISHPVRRYIGKDISALTQMDGTLQAIMNLLGHNAVGAATEIVDSITAESHFVVSENVDLTDWEAIVVFNTRETQDPGNTVRTYQRAATATIVLFFCSASFLLLRAYRGAERNLWTFSVACSVFFFAGIVATWAFAVTGGARGDHQGVYVLDAAAAEATVTRHLERSGSDPDQIVRIPTGVFVQSLTFTSANNVRLTGYLWQRKSAASAHSEDQSLPGFILPEAEEMVQTKAWETDEVIGWYFETTVRQQFDYSRYPFDREDVWIRLWPASMNPNVILVPDFDSYRERRIDGSPGVERDFVLEGWSIKNSYFSFRTNSYNVDFGRAGFSPEQSLELYFNVGLVRNFVSPFISDMIPVFVIAFLVFAVLMCSTKNAEQVALYGFSTSAVLAYCAALFFVLIVSHVNLRNTLSSHGIIYMEFFYFVMYLVILAVSANSLLFASSRRIPLIDHKDNIVVKQLYWPLLVGLLFLITLFVFR